MSLLLVTIVFLLWVASKIVYRLFFHPLVGFPGPKIAHISYIYEWYYDLYLRGQYTFKIRELHKKYGPVVRITPDELHFNDPDFYDEIYNVSNGRTEKPYRAANVFGPYPAAIGTIDHDLHRIRRGALNPFFSKRSVSEMVPFIQSIIEKMCNRFQDASKTGEPINSKYCYAALSFDIMSEYCFSRTSDRILKPDFDRKSFDDIDDFVDMSLVNLHIPGILNAVASLPDRLSRLISTAMADILDERSRLSRLVEDIRLGHDQSHEASGHRTIFHELLESDLPPQEKAKERLRDEAFSLVTAGSGTTSFTLKCTSYHIMANANVHYKLLEELRTVMPHPQDFAELQTLQNLPYLTAIILEGLRLSHPVTHRMARSFPNKTLRYGDKDIPPGTTVFMTSLLMHENEDIFPDPRVFRPERWLGGDQQRLQRYLTPFTRGSRACLGINLAWAEMYLILASVFRRFEFDISGIVRERDIDVVRDVILGAPSNGSTGAIVKVLPVFGSTG